jgi:hypothetical protein
MANERLLVTTLVAVMVLSLFAIPGMAVAEPDVEPTLSTAEDELDDENASDDDDDVEKNESNESGENGETGSLSLDVEQNGTDVTLTVTEDGDGLENESVTASTDENESYAGNGTHTSDENGTVSLEAPTGTDSVEVTFEATVDGEEIEETATLESVDEDSEDENDTENFGSVVSAFVEETKDNESDEPLGLQVAGFVVENNPGSAPDHAGPPGHAGPPSDDSEHNQGPPSHAGPPGEEGDEESADNASNGNGNGNGGGPPDHAGGSSR